MDVTQPDGGDAMNTLSEEMNRLAAAGYDLDWRAEDGMLICGQCSAPVDPQTVTIDEVVRFEGASDPDDESMLFALTAPCGHRGVYSTPYGPDATADDVTVIRHLARRTADR